MRSSGAVNRGIWVVGLENNLAEYIKFDRTMSGIGKGGVCVWARTGERVCAGDDSRWI
jgi:hypothetical protein